MDLTIDEAAARLGKSPWQVRYMIKVKGMPARKQGGRWFVREEDLLLTPGQQRAVARKEREFRAAVDRGVGLDAEPRQDRYSVHQLKGFQIGLPLFRQAVETFGPDHVISALLHSVLQHLSCGCHRFEKADKAAAYAAARDAAARAVCELVIADDAASGAMVTAIEQELMAALAGLMRRHARRGARRPGGREATSRPDREQEA